MQGKNKLNGYRLYSVTDEVHVYFSDLIAALTAIFIATIITFGLYYFWGITIAVIFNATLSLLFYSYLYYYGKSNTNITFGFVFGFVLITAFLLFIDIGPILWVIYLKTDQFYKTYFQIWVSLVLGIPTLYYTFLYSRYYLHKWSMAKDFVYLRFSILHDRDLLILFEDVQFANTHRKMRSNIEIGKPNCYYSQNELMAMDIRTRNRILDENPFDEVIYLPIGTNKLFLTWYSIVEDQYYDLEIDFPFEKLQITRDKYPSNVHQLLRNKKTIPLQLQISQNGGLGLFNKEMLLLEQKSNRPIPISEELKKQKKEVHRQVHQYYKDPKAFDELTNQIKISKDIEERYLIQHLTLPWSLEIKNLESKHMIEIWDVSFRSYRSKTNELQNVLQRSLPEKLILVYQGDYLYPWFTLHINSLNLYRQIIKHTKANHKVPIRFVLYVTANNTDIKFSIETDENSSLFLDCEVEIDQARFKDAETQWKRNKTLDSIKMLMNEAWDLVKSREYDKAQEKCNAIIDLEPQYGFAYFLKLRLLWYQKGFEACIARKEYFINKTEHEPPALAHIYNSYGCLYDEEMKYKEALDFFENANRLVPKMAIYVANLAEIHYKLKNRKEAVLYAKEAQEKGDSSNIVQEILKNKGIINEVDFLEIELGKWAVKYRKGSENDADEKNIIEQYHQTFDRLIQINKGMIALDPDCELPDRLMPKAYVDYWHGKKK